MSQSYGESLRGERREKDRTFRTSYASRRQNVRTGQQCRILSTVIERSETTQEARLMIKRAAVSTSFVTKNTMIPSERIEMTLKEGPFRSLNGCWTFQALTEGACKVTLNIQFEIDNPLLKSTLGKVFEQIATTMVDAFCNRADQLNKLKAQNTGTEEP